MDKSNVMDIMKDLVNYYDNYIKSEPAEPFNLQAFSIWLFHQEEYKIKSSVVNKLNENTKGISDEVHSESFQGGIDDRISFILLSMHRLIKFYVKKVLEGTQMVSLDDIHYLMFLSQTDSLTKSEIINSSISEMSSGIEVIKRLQKKGLIEDFEDPRDKRSKRVKITPQGLSEIKKVTSKFGSIHKLLVSIIPQEEKYSLLAMLSKIYEFHLRIFNSEKNTSLEELFAKYLKEDLSKFV